MENNSIHKMRVYTSSDYHCKPVAMIRLKGRWLENIGFIPGTPIDVQYKHGQLIIKVNNMKDRASGN